MEHDLFDNGIEPFQVARYYDSQSKQETFLGGLFGFQFPLLASDTQDGARHSYGMISERDGFFIPYQRSKGSSFSHYKIDPRLLKKGYTNLSRAEVSGHANFVNWMASHRHHKHNKNTDWEVHLGDGSQRIYGCKIDLPKELRKHLNFPTKKAYLLTEEVKPNGNRVKYQYQPDSQGCPHLSEVLNLNRTGRAVLNKLQIHRSGLYPLRYAFSIQNSCADQASYSYQCSVHKAMIDVNSSTKGLTHYDAEVRHIKHQDLLQPFYFVNKITKPRGARI